MCFSSPTTTSPIVSQGVKQRKRPIKKPLPVSLSQLCLAREAVTVCTDEIKERATASYKSGWCASDIFGDGTLFLGSANDAVNKESLKEHKITHVLNATKECGNIEDLDIKTLRIAVRDHCDAPLSEHFAEAAKWIAAALSEGGKVLVHCKGGVSRSSTLVAAFLMVNRHMTCDSALDMIRTRRSIISPNIGFLLSLEAFEKVALPFPLRRTNSCTSEHLSLVTKSELVAPSVTVA
eukprot:TRINITY_DN2170_c0_g1_i1.p1 TRINITY_DN2170_c0_g1~~TRINITY_DN2170_c0_g1_i1.p1  ORF type:complete len:236 (+),score=41.30 TRINITY_DN2170_c0_g1_i1:61-768(+)